jgi:hypothetical protein
MCSLCTPWKMQALPHVGQPSIAVCDLLGKGGFVTVGFPLGEDLRPLMSGQKRAELMARSRRTYPGSDANLMATGPDTVTNY